MTSDEILKVKGISKHFGKIVALESITFEVKKGEFVFITGPSGSGKTTLLRLILREFLPDSGEIIFEGINLNGVSQKEIPSLRQKIGVVFQDFKVLPERTVRENVEIALAVKGIEENEWKARVDQVLKLVGLLTRADLFPRQLSGGELQRLSLARALVVNPDLILADEPTGNLDWDTSESLMDLFNKINEEGKTIIMSTHNRMIVDKLKKREIKLKEGQIETLKEVEPEAQSKPKAKVKVKVEEV